MVVPILTDVEPDNGCNVDQLEDVLLGGCIITHDSTRDVLLSCLTTIPNALLRLCKFIFTPDI